MLFSSIVFLYYFLPITMLLYWIMPYKYKNVYCFIVSLFFYAWGEPVYIFVMLFSILVNYILVLRMDELEGKRRKKILVLSVIFNIGMLIIFKYTGFILSNITDLFGIEIHIPNIKLPLGISFFTFQALSYVIDVYRYHAESQISFIKVGLYISAFPQLIAGPIVRYNTVMDQIDNRVIDLEKIQYGVWRFIIGLSKKVLLANQFAIVADYYFRQGHIPDTVLGAWLGAVAYSLQIYYDFSGYSDMAIGLGAMLGFEYEENFNYPYISKSITEFWRRWHISLSRWFRDYLYIPLGGNKVKTRRHIFNLFIVWLMTGFWHGAEWTFIVWGLYYFLLITLETYVIKLEMIPKWLKHLSTFILVMVGWVIFRSENMTDALNYLGSMININLGLRQVVSANILLHDYWYVFVIGVLGSTPTVKKIFKSTKMYKSNSIFFAIGKSIGVSLLLIFATMYLVNSTYNPFIYFRF